MILRLPWDQRRIHHLFLIKLNLNGVILLICILINYDLPHFPSLDQCSARDRGLGTIIAAQERGDYSSFSAGGREGDEVPRE